MALCMGTRSYLRKSSMGIPGFCYQVYKYVMKKGLIREGDRVVLGLSGGADSVCLFLCLFFMRDLLPFSLTAVHVNHGIRIGEADRDEAFVKALAERFRIPLTVAHVDAVGYAKENALSLEEAARVLRYREFRKIAEPEAALIAVAHHMEDQAETVLFQMIRGCSLHGLSGMRPEKDGIIRPLLFAHRQEILAFLREQEQDFCTDSTNKDTEYARNALRLKVVPELLKVNEGAVDHLARLAEEAHEVEEFLEEPAEEAWKKAAFWQGEELRLRKKEMDALPDVLKKKVVYRALYTVSGEKKDISEVHVNYVLHLFSSEGGKKIALPGRMTAGRRKGFVFLTRE